MFKKILGVLFILIALYFAWLFSLHVVTFWLLCYKISLCSAFIFLIYNRDRYFTPTFIFVCFCVIGHTFPAMPFLLYEGFQNIEESIFISSIGLTVFTGVALFLSSNEKIRCTDEIYLSKPSWIIFYEINKKIFYATIPLVLLTMSLTGGWRVLVYGLQESGFSRTGSLRGFGPMMIFCSLNAYAAIFWAIGVWVAEEKKIKSMAILLFMLYINSFTHGRDKIIWLSITVICFYGFRHKFSLKVVFFAVVLGLTILSLKVFRGGETEEINDYLLYFFLNFAGDFVELADTQLVLDYTKTNSFFGLYHILSNPLMMVPRSIFPDKPIYIGQLYIDSFIFPGLYTKEGGTGMGYGTYGSWYAVSGITSLVLGVGLLCLLLVYVEYFLKARLKNFKPSFFIIFYLSFMSQSIVLYRDGGTYAFQNAFMHSVIYILFYQFFKKINGHNKPPRILAE